MAAKASAGRKQFRPGGLSPAQEDHLARLILEQAPVPLPCPSAPSPPPSRCTTPVRSKLVAVTPSASSGAAKRSRRRASLFRLVPSATSSSGGPDTTREPLSLPLPSLRSPRCRAYALRTTSPPPQGAEGAAAPRRNQSCQGVRQAYTLRASASPCAGDDEPAMRFPGGGSHSVTVGAAGPTMSGE